MENKPTKKIFFRETELELIFQANEYAKRFNFCTYSYLKSCKYVQLSSIYDNVFFKPFIAF